MCIAGAGYISQALKEHTNEKLVDLDLGYNEIKDEGACAVAQVRTSLSSIASMSAGTCHIAMQCSVHEIAVPACHGLAD